MNIELVYNFIRDNASEGYRDRVPVATQENITAVGNAIAEYSETRNEFLDTLVNKFAFSLVSFDELESDFRSFMGQKIENGDTIEDVFIEMAKGMDGVAIVDGETIDPYKVTLPQIKVLYHKIDSKTYYPVTVEHPRLKRALLSKGAGLETFTAGFVQSLKTGREYDHYLMGTRLLSVDKMYGKKIHVNGEGDEQKLAFKVVSAIKDTLSKIKYMRDDFNALGVTTRTPRESIVVFMREDVKNSIDINVLKGLFNMNKLDIDVQLMEVDKFVKSTEPTDEYVKEDLMAVVVDRRGLRINNAEEEMETQRNGLGQYTNYFLHVSDLFSFARFRNAVAITGEIGEADVEATGTVGA